ncbi:hypothetical protein HDU99_006456 [Rhizoclosmatium hyalinum]|nr:hypothetical protein HDU99_006456 [Rhizoclosmatium hyalinum]
MKQEPTNEEGIEATKKKLEHKQVSWFREREAEQLAKSKEFLDKLEKEREEKRQLQDKMAQFEARNMKKEQRTSA